MADASAPTTSLSVSKGPLVAGGGEPELSPAQQVQSSTEYVCLAEQSLATNVKEEQAPTSSDAHVAEQTSDPAQTNYSDTSGPDTKAVSSIEITADGGEPVATAIAEDSVMQEPGDAQTSTDRPPEKTSGTEVVLSSAVETSRKAPEATRMDDTTVDLGHSSPNKNKEPSLSTTQDDIKPEGIPQSSSTLHEHAATQSTPPSTGHGDAGQSNSHGSHDASFQQRQLPGPSSPRRAPRSSASAPAFTRLGPSPPTSLASLPGQMAGPGAMFGQGRGRGPPSMPGPSNFHAQQYHHPHPQQPSPVPIPLTPTLPSTSSSTLPTTEARDAIIASMSNLLDHKLQTRATQLHSNSAALAKQEADVARATEGLRRETAKLERVATDAGRKIKELGNVQNWAEVLERDLLVIEETIRLANRPRRPRGGREGAVAADGEDEEEYATSDEEGSERCSECEGSCCWSGSGSRSGSENGDGDDRHNDRDGEHEPARGSIFTGHAPQPANIKSSGVKIEINDELLASLSEAMRLDIYSGGKDRATSSSHVDPMDSGISLASTTEQQSTPSLCAVSGTTAVGGGEGSQSASSLSVNSRLGTI